MSDPRFSVVIPTYERRETLARTLAAWERQEPRDLPFELVVIDDGSSDGTIELLARQRPERYTLRYERQENLGPAAARNRALQVARGELVLFAGDDIEPSAKLLATHADAHRRWTPGTLAVVGRIDWPEELPRTATMRLVTGVGAQQFSFHYMKDGTVYDYRHFYTSNVSIARRTLDLEPGHFTTSMPAAAFEDAELALRLSRHGLVIRYCASALAWHWHAYDAAGFFRRQLRCGEMAQTLVELHPECAGLLGVPHLERVRRKSWWIDRFGKGRLGSLMSELPRRTPRAVELAARLDGKSDEVASPLLLALFDYGYSSGLAEARFSGPTARRVQAALFAERLDSLVD